MTYRPNVSQVRNYYWLTESGSRVDGIGLMRRGRLLVHLTPNEAIQLANNIIDTLEGQKPMTEKFNVVPCGSCGQKYAGQGHIVHYHGQATNVVCPPCYETGGVPSTHPELEESTPDPHGHWHDALTLIEQYHDHQAVSDMLNTMTRPEIERTMFALTGLIHHRATMFEEIQDTQQWAATFRETYQELIENPSSDNENE